MISFILLVVTLFRFFFGQVDLELLLFIAECVTNIKNNTNLTPLSDARARDIRYFKLNTAGQDGPLMLA